MSRLDRKRVHQRFQQKTQITRATKLTNLTYPTRVDTSLCYASSHRRWSTTVSMEPQNAFLEPLLGLTWHLGASVASIGSSWGLLACPSLRPCCLPRLGALSGLLGALLSIRLIILLLLPDGIQCYRYGNLDVGFWASGGTCPELQHMINHFPTLAWQSIRSRRGNPSGSPREKFSVSPGDPETFRNPLEAFLEPSLGFFKLPPPTHCRTSLHPPPQLNRTPLRWGLHRSPESGTPLRWGLRRPPESGTPCDLHSLIGAGRA